MLLGFIAGCLWHCLVVSSEDLRKVGQARGRAQISKKLIYGWLLCHFMLQSLDRISACTEVSDSASGKVGKARPFLVIGVGAYTSCFNQAANGNASSVYGPGVLSSFVIQTQMLYYFFLTSVNTIPQFVPKTGKRNWVAAIC